MPAPIEPSRGSDRGGPEPLVSAGSGASVGARRSSRRGRRGGPAGDEIGQPGDASRRASPNRSSHPSRRDRPVGFEALDLTSAADVHWPHLARSPVEAASARVVNTSPNGPGAEAQDQLRRPSVERCRRRVKTDPLVPSEC